MGRITLDGDPPIEVALRQSAQARRISLRVSGLDGRVTLTVPHRVPAREARGFLAEKEGWLRAALARQLPVVRVEMGAELPFEGRPLPVRPGTGRAARITDTAILVPDEPGKIGRRLQTALRTAARHRLAQAAERYAGAIGKDFGRLTLRDTRSRWGSCSSRGDLMFSWRLIMAPAEVLDYVAAHEVAHLEHMHHQATFWNLVARICPDFEASRKWLRTEGNSLHRYDFGD